jgi:hypothetical protein
LVNLSNRYSVLLRMTRNVNLNYSMLRARIVSHGTTLSRWARKKGYPATTVYGAAKGERSGIKAVRIRRQLEQEFPI